MVHAHDETSVVESREIEFSCPVCGETNLVDVFRFKTVSKLYGFLTAWVAYETSLKCSNCMSTFRSKRSPVELAEFTSEETARSFRIKVGFVEKFLVICGWLVVCAAPVTLFMFIAAYFKLQPAAVGWRRASIAGMVVSGVFTILVLGSIFFAE